MKNFRGVRPKAGTRGSGEGWRVGDLFKVSDQHSKRSLRALREAGTLQRFPHASIGEQASRMRHATCLPAPRKQAHERSARAFIPQLLSV